MTVFLPLEAEKSLPQTPSFLVPPSTDRNAGLAKVVQALLKAKRIVVICGAGISVRAGIPDFRSADGLFKSLKRDNPRESLSSGKDLFDASVFNSEHTTSLFCQMMAQLSDMSQNAEPTAFHQLLRALDDRGRLLRVYTQNIDAIEQKSGLSFGVPDFEGKKSRARKTKQQNKEALEQRSVDPHHSRVDVGTGQPEASTSRLPTPTPETPRCIPLHGTLQQMHCQICSHSFPLLDHLPSLIAGQPPRCPECTHLERTRALVGKRPRGIGKLRPSVVLYNEAHNNGEGVGNVVQKDLIGSSKGKGRSGADFLLVVGTSLRIPGTKRMVREFAKAVRSRGGGAPSKSAEEASSSGAGGSATPNGSSSRSSPSIDDDPPPAPMKSVYLNLDFPVPTREWEGVFDAWVQGDAQSFAEMLQEEIKKEAKAKELISERKRRREEEAAAAAANLKESEDVEMEDDGPESVLPTPQTTPQKKRGSGTSSKVTPSKRHKQGGNEAKEGSRNERMDCGTTRSANPPTPPSSCRQEYIRSAIPTPEASPPYPLRRSSQPHLAMSYSPAYYRSSFATLNILTSSMRSTLEDHERAECFSSPSLIEVGQWGYRGDS